MKSVAYGGPYQAVDIPSLGCVARKGEPIEVEDEIAESLLRQGWTEIKAKKGTAN